MMTDFIKWLIICLAVSWGGSYQPESVRDWNILEENAVWIGWANDGGVPWCKAKSVIQAPLNSIMAILEDQANYPEVFERVESTVILGDGVVLVSLDMPFPFSSRDYVVKYTQQKSGSDIIYNFHSVTHSEAPERDGFVRLINAAGEWRLHPINENETEVSYIWNGELLGDFPHWALTRAWATQGAEVMDWLATAVQ